MQNHQREKVHEVLGGQAQVTKDPLPVESGLLSFSSNKYVNTCHTLPTRETH